MKSPFDDMTMLWGAGCLMALSSFGVKVGLGLAAELFDESLSAVRRWGFSIATLGAYGLLFLGVCPLNRWFEGGLVQFDAFFGLARYGALVHLAVALGLLVWGTALLLRSGRDGSTAAKTSGRNGGAWLLIMPCPVCAVVILAVGLAGCRLLATSAVMVSMLLSSLFWALVLTTVLVALPFRRRIAAARGRFLGIVMTAVAVYYFLTLLIAPVYQEARDVFAVARQQPQVAVLGHTELVLFVSVAAALFAAGFVYQRFRFGKIGYPRTHQS